MIRVLDPSTAPVRRGRSPVLPTAYVAEHLLVRGEQVRGRLDDRVVARLKQLGLALSPPPEKPSDRRRYDVNVKLESEPVGVYTLTVADDRPTDPPDAWVALQEIALAAPEVADDFELNHVLTAAGGGYWGGIGGGYWSGIGGGYWGGIGGGYWGGIGGGYWGGIGSPTPAEFGIPGFGGRSPVALVIDDPAKSAPQLKRPPVVVMPDTGIGYHPWFRDEQTSERRTVPTALAPAVTVLRSPVPDEEPGVSEPLVGDLDRLAGHGTFIAGIVRQTCPAARLVAYAVMSSAGVMMEDELLGVLHEVLDQQLEALATGNPARIVDVLSLSVGYYHEELGSYSSEKDLADALQGLAGSSVAAVLRDLGRAGVLVVAGAGNDATDRVFLPAGLAGQVTGLDHDALPLVSVGSLNPDGTQDGKAATVSLFSNAGRWVTTYRPGAAIVSTLPMRGNAGAQASASVAPDPANNPDLRRRATIDRDDFSSGFGVWSGTSFATPVVAGQLAQALVGLGTEAVTLDAMLDRGWRAIEQVLGSEGVRRP